MDIVFGTKWFEKHQERLLWLLNTPIIKIWFRWVMRIRKSDCDTFINRITPNSISYNVKVTGDKIEVTTDFRTHDKYAKRLYFAFKPFWYLLHVIDWVAFDRYEYLTKLNFGFSTLTQYPGSIGTDDPVDGRVNREVPGGGTFASLRADAGTNFNFTATSGTVVRISNDSPSTNYDSLYRAVYGFDTSALTSGATISAVTFSIYGVTDVDATGTYSQSAVIDRTVPASDDALVASDYNIAEWDAVEQATARITFASWNASGYNDFTLNATGIGNISKTGLSWIGVRGSGDFDNSAPSFGADYSTASISGYYSNNSGTTNDPKIVVTYTLPAGPANLKSLDTNVKANIKSYNTNVLENIKSINTNV